MNTHYKAGFFTQETQSFNEDLQISSGGLGVVAASILATAEDEHFPMVACCLYPTKGYYQQTLVGNGMGINYLPNNCNEAVKSTGKFFTLQISGMQVKVEILTLTDKVRHHTAVYLLSTDLDENQESVRAITRTLYAGKHAAGVDNSDWLKMAQAFVLGWGSRVAFETLGISVDIWHLNESHAAFAQMFHLNKLLDSGYTFDQAVKDTITSHVFTNHTVVGAGNACHNTGVFCNDIARDFPHMNIGLFELLGFSDGNIPMSELCLKLSCRCNGVSELHGEILRKTWNDPTIRGILNGIYLPEWQMKEYTNMKNPSEIPEIKIYYKRLLVEECKKRASKYGSSINERVLFDNLVKAMPLLGSARRWTEYKRMNLLFYDENINLVRSLLDMGLLSIVWGGKPHPDDHQAITDWNWLFRQSQDHMDNTLLYLDYDLKGMRLLKAASDIWANFMWYANEACGTSGMSAALDCSFNLSVADGMFAELFMKGNFAPYGSSESGDWDTQYKYDAKDIWKVLIKDVMPMYWHPERSGIYSKLFDIKQMAEEHFSSSRSFQEYREKLYKM